MYTLRLFHQADLSREIEARRLDEGDLAIGRDAAADWSIVDPARTLSRRHCVLTLKDGALSLCDTSANGVYLGATRHRLDLRKPTPVASGDAFQLGDFVIVVEEQRSFAAPDDSPFDAPFRHPILDDSQIGAEHLEVRSDWPDALSAELPAQAQSSDGALLEAFCSGAGLDVSAFSGQDPAVVMHRLGEVYRQMVLGLGELIQDRSSAKSRYRVERTRVRAEGNNPFKWAAPQRVAVDLLRGGGAAFLEGPDAVAAAFVDLKKHQLAMLAGMRAAIAATLDGLSPDSVEAAQERQSLLKAKVNWAEYIKLYETLRRQAEADPDSPLNRSFASAYERRLEELDALKKPAKVPA